MCLPKNCTFLCIVTKRTGQAVHPSNPVLPTLTGRSSAGSQAKVFPLICHPCLSTGDAGNGEAWDLLHSKHVLNPLRCLSAAYSYASYLSTCGTVCLAVDSGITNPELISTSDLIKAVERRDAQGALSSIRVSGLLSVSSQSSKQSPGYLWCVKVTGP